MKSTFFIILIFTCGWLIAQQNLIPNPSFEEFTSCPLENELGQGEFLKCKGWWYPHPSHIGTPDYFNRCNNATTYKTVGVPKNFWGYQEAFDGDGYIGVDLASFNVNSKEFYAIELVTTRLLTPLEICNNYHFRAYVNRSNKAAYASNYFGMLFSRDSLWFDDFEQIVDTDTSILIEVLMDDTLEWTLIEGDFIARGGEEYLTIGFFDNYNFSQWQLLDTSLLVNFPNEIYTYIYLDSLSLTQTSFDDNCSLNLPNIFTPNYDGDNDQFNISYYNLDQLFIYNRWGNLLIELNEAHPIWDGTYQGEACSEGIYYYVGEYKNKPLKGTIQLVR